MNNKQYIFSVILKSVEEEYPGAGYQQIELIKNARDLIWNLEFHQLAHRMEKQFTYLSWKKVI